MVGTILFKAELVLVALVLQTAAIENKQSFKAEDTIHIDDLECCDGVSQVLHKMWLVDASACQVTLILVTGQCRKVELRQWRPNGNNATSPSALTWRSVAQLCQV